MLKKVFQSDPIRYYRRGEYWVDMFHVDYHVNVEPYIESLDSVSGMFVQSIPTLRSSNSIYLFTVFHTSYWPSWAPCFHRFDSVSGQYISRIPIGTAGSTVVLTGGCKRSRRGRLYFRHFYGDRLLEVSLGAGATLPANEMPEVPDAFSYTGVEINVSQFPGLLSFGASGDIGIDETNNVLLNGSFRNLQVYNLTTGALKYTVELPDNIACIALEDSNRAYILLGNRTLVLYDYAKQEVMGVVKVPKLVSSTLEYWNNTNVSISWDFLYRRLLVCEPVPDNPDGSCATTITGYRSVPVPTRLTVPIPLMVPRKSRIIPVMTQVVGDMNEGVGGHIVKSVLSRDASLVGLPITDNLGRAITQVLCDEVGSGTIVCSVQLPPDPKTDSVVPSQPDTPRVKLQLGGVDFEYKGMTGFTLFLRYNRGETANVAAFFAAASSLGRNVIRVIGMLGETWWVGAGYAYYPGDGSTNNTSVGVYCTQVQAFVTAANAAGIKIEWVFFADISDIPAYQTQAARLSMVTAVTTALLGIAGVLFEIVNEPDQNSLNNLADLVALANAVKAVDPSRNVALGASNGGSWQALTYAVAPATYLTFHGNRGDDWSWLTQYYGSAPLTQQLMFPIEDEPQRPEFDGEIGKYFALGCLGQILQFAVTAHYLDGCIAKPPTDHVLACLQALQAGNTLVDWDFGGKPFVDYTDSPLSSKGADPKQVVGRQTATDAMMIVMGCPAGWTPSWAAGWSAVGSAKWGTADCAQYWTAKKAGGSGGTGGGTDHSSMVSCVKSALGPANTAGAAGAFEITKRVAWLLRGETSPHGGPCGLLLKPAGENIISWMGQSFAAGRVCYPSGQIYKIMTDVGGTNGPQWADDGMVDVSRYVAAIDPGTGINMDWSTCGG